MKLKRNSDICLVKNIVFKICKDSFCIYGELRTYLKQCNNKIRSAISSVQKVISKHAVSMLILMIVNITYKPGGSEAIDTFVGRVCVILKHFRLSAHLRLVQL